MKRLACRSLIVGLLSLPIPVQAQVLTLAAVDCSLDLTVFKVYQVTGVDLAPSPEMLPGWRNHLINMYPTLPDRYSIANACSELGNLVAKWPQMPLVERELRVNIWAASLPQDLALMEPVYDRARQLRAELQLRAIQQRAAPSATPNTDAEAIAELKRQHEIAETLQNPYRP
jgi:hypothetical protein